MFGKRKVEVLGYVLENAKEFTRQSGGRIQRLHRYVVGWCKALNRQVCICLGVVRDWFEVDYQSKPEVRKARIMFERWLEKVGASHAVAVLNLAIWRG